VEWDGENKPRISEKQKRFIFAGTSDSRINVELLRKIRFCAQAILELKGRPSETTSRRIRLICPTGESICSADV